jgi:DNA-binding transcriptional LysR family regulator
MIELRELGVFLTLADALHFGHTAKRLGITPSRVSQDLRKLEQKLGDQVLHRTSRRVTLTPFGEEFLAAVGPAYERLAEVLLQAQTANHRLEGTLRLGHLFLTAGGSHLTTIIEAFERRYPDCEVHLSEVLFDDPLGPLHRGEVDAIASPMPLEVADIVVGPTLSTETRVLQVARAHPLADRTSVSMEDIADYEVIPLNRFPPETVEALIPQTTPAGRPIRRRPLRRPLRTPLEAETLVARGLVVHPTVPSYASYFRSPDIVHIPIRDMPSLTTALAWQRRSTHNPRLRAFARLTIATTTTADASARDASLG